MHCFSRLWLTLLAALCGTLSMFAPGFAAGQHCGGFTRIGDRFPDVAKAMSAEELVLFRRVRLIVEEEQRADVGDWLAVMPNAGRNSVHSVKINSAGDVLVNLKPDIKPRMQPIGNDRYYAHVADRIHIYMASVRNKEPERVYGYVPWPYHVCFVFNGMAPFANEDIPMRWPTWFVPRYGPSVGQDDFAKRGHVYADLAKPMTLFERSIFNDLHAHLKTARHWGTRDGDTLPAHPEKSLLGVKVNKHGAVLVNLRKDMPSYPSDMDDTHFYHYFTENIYRVAIKKFDIRRVTYMDDEKLPEIAIRLAFEGHDTNSRR